MRISDWSSDVCSSDLDDAAHSRRDDEVDRVPQLARQLGGERRGEAAGAVAVHQDACALQVIFAVTARGEEEMPVQQGVGGTELGQDVIVGPGRMISFVQQAEIGRASCRERVCQYV